MNKERELQRRDIMYFLLHFLILIGYMFFVLALNVNITLAFIFLGFLYALNLYFGSVVLPKVERYLGNAMGRMETVEEIIKVFEKRRKRP